MKAGYYRYKISDLKEGEYEFKWYVDGIQNGTSKVIVKPFCPNDKYIKYLSNEGFYRFFPFNSYFETKDSVKQIGTTNNLITSLKNTKSNISNIGYTVSRTLSLVADNVSEAELDILSDIYASPKVYIKLKEKDEWLEVIINSDNIVHRRKNQFGKITINVTLPERYTISKI